jgi:general secretion pathway protein H
MIVMVILAIVMGGVVMGSGQMSSSRLKHGATALTGSVRVAFTRATATSKSMRLVFDIDASTMWLEEGDAPMLVQSKDTTGTGGANPLTDAEKAAVQEADTIVKGPRAPRASFRPVSGATVTQDVTPNANAPAATPGGKGPIPLPRGIKFREVQTAHDDAPRTSGRAYLYFWPGGLTERASIQLRVGDSVESGDTLSLMVAPLTGKVTVKNGPVALVIPHDDKESSEREDTGF